MTLLRMLGRSLVFHWRSHLGVVLGSAVGAAALIGALVVGDSVRETLKARAETRLGLIGYALESGDRLFGADLAERMGWGNIINANRSAALNADGAALPGGGAAALMLRGTAARTDGTARAHGVQMLAVPMRFWALSRAHGWTLTSLPVEGTNHPALDRQFAEFMQLSGKPSPGKVRLNTALARQLNVTPGDTVLLRFPKPSALSQDAILSPRSEASAALRLEVEDLVPDDALGAFSLRSGQRPALNAFLNADDMARAAGVTNRANLLLVQGAGSAGSGGADLGAAGASAQTVAVLSEELERRWRLDDAELNVRVIEEPVHRTGGARIPAMIEVSSPRVFLPEAVVQAATRMAPGADPAEAGYVTGGVQVVTYLANALRAGDRLTPYSMVAGAGAPWTASDLGPDEIVVNDWLARDLGVKPGDEIRMEYFDPEAGATLRERTNTFRVRSVVPLRGLHADRTLMPEFPGLAKAESTSDWDAGFPLVHPIRDQDEAYWKTWRGTPKAFVSLETGRKLWGNRFGAVTAVRYGVPPGSFPSGYQRLVEGNLRANLQARDVGLVFQPVREQALRGATSGQDFGQLFLGFSFFLVIAALLLTGLLFRFGLEQRLPEVGTLLAVGFRPRAVRWLWLAEGLGLAVIGALLGVAGGVAYARSLIHGLGTLWRDAVAGAALDFHLLPASVVAGVFASVVIAVATLSLTLRRQATRPVRALLAGEIAEPAITGRRWTWGVGLLLVLAGAGLAGWATMRGETANAGLFFGAGGLLLVGGLMGVAGWLAGMGEGRLDGAGAGAVSGLGALAMRNAVRRRGRSLTTIGLLASGIFLVVAIGAFRMDAERDSLRRSSGTGGFALLGESSLPVSADLNTAAGLEFFGLGTNDLPGVNVVPFRVRDGDDASCLNLNRAQRPRILGVDPALLASRGAFRFASVASGVSGTGWELLRAGGLPPKGEDTGIPEYPAIGDAASIQWALGKKVGDVLELTDERGPFRLRLVAGLANSLLQGNLVVDEAVFTRLFPSETGYRYFLIDAPAAGAAEVSATLSRALQDVGLEMVPASRRLAEFNAVQNTYLNTFQVLGGLGLLLGSAGLGVVVLRNVLERRGELALLVSVGFRRGLVSRLVLWEHAGLLLAGLALGLVSAAVAILPALVGNAREVPWGSLSLTLAGVLVLGLGTTWAATRASLRGSLLAGLRGE